MPKGILPKKRCENCGELKSINNYQKHVSVCSGPSVKKIRGVDFDPNSGFKDGSRKQWNKGLSKSDWRVEKYSKSLKERRYSFEFIAENFDSVALVSKRKLIFHEQNGCCNRCKISSWLGEKLTLELEHKDGNNENNSRSNLEMLCPNCHSLTPTWRGRKLKWLSSSVG